MPANYEWNALPEAVRDAVESHVGKVSDATTMREGQTCDVAATLRLPNGQKVFLKGVRGVSRRMRFLRNETTAGKLAPGLAPTTFFHEDVEAGDTDWLMVGFEHVVGRAASLTPGSADLPLIASTVNRIAELPATGFGSLLDRWSGGKPWRDLLDEAVRLTDNWNLPVDKMMKLGEKAPEFVHGDRLVHTDLHADQFIVGANSEIHVIDWGFPGAGAPWVDAGFLIIRLIGAGHKPEAAEEWARRYTHFSVATDEAATAFAAFIAGLWSYWAATDSEQGAGQRAQMARDYAAYRLKS